VADTADETDETRFHHEHLPDFAACGSHRFEDANFAGAFINGHDHGVGEPRPSIIGVAQDVKLLSGA
jgi:hypothetical protein